MSAVSIVSGPELDNKPGGSGKLRMLSRETLAVRLALRAFGDELEPLTPAARLEAIEQQWDGRSVLGYLAYALPEREAIWWACMCLHYVVPPDWPEPQRRALEAAQQWVRRPDEATRRAMLPTVREAGGSTPASFVARAVFTSRLAQPGSLRAGLSVWHAVLGAVGSAFGPSPYGPEGGEKLGDRVTPFRSSALDIAHGGAGRIAGEGAAV